ncbi:MAG: BRO family class A beta-lactamase, partial [Moraxella sp.]|nr:BRO family class A beta-lactamase [Moraxella sp.]
MQRRHFLQKTLLALPIIFSGNLLTGCKTSLSNNHLPNDKITKNP